MKKKGFVFFVFFLLVSCVPSIGTIELPINRYAYNESLQYSEMQQQLLNIVRLRYSDPPYFLSVNSIVSQTLFTKEGEANAAANSVFGLSRTLIEGGVRASLSDKPTVTFSPLQGTEFVTRLMTPIDLSVIYMLLRAGWGVSHIFRPLIERLGPIDNVKLASRVTSSRIPQYKEFKYLSNVLRNLQHAEHLTTSKKKTDDGFSLRFDVASFATLSREERATLRKINISPETPYFELTSKPDDGPHTMYVQTRTVLGMFNYFSKGVDVPEADIRNKQVPMTYYPSGQIFDWHQVPGELFRVRVCSNRPSNALVSVKYRKHWFYISDSDFESKESLMLITIIMGIYEGKIESFLPVFTVN